MPSQRRAFFRRTVAYYRRRRPAGYRLPSGAAGLKHRLVALDSYPLYAALRQAYRVTGRRADSRGTEQVASDPDWTPAPSPAMLAGQPAQATTTR